MKTLLKRRFFIIAVLMAVVSVSAVSAQSASEQTAVEEQSQDNGSSSAIKYIAAALAVGIACVGGGMAVGKIGAAAMGAMSENAELSGKALLFVGLACQQIDIA